MIVSKKSLRLTFMVLIGAILFSFCFFWGNISHSKTDNEVTDIQKDEAAFEKPEAFVDPVEDSVTTEERKAINKVLTKLKKKVADKGLEEIEFPFPPADEKEDEEADTEDEAMVEDEAEGEDEDETDVEAEKEKDKAKFSMYIPTIAKGIPCVLRTDDGKVQGNFFVYTSYNWKNTTIQVWRLTFEITDEEDKDGDKKWKIVDKIIIKTMSNLLPIYSFRDNIYSFSKFEFTHDRIHAEFKDGYFVTQFAGEMPIGGYIFGKGSFSYDPPRQLAKDVTDSDNETYQLMRYTGSKEDDKYSGGKTKLDKEPCKDGFIFMHPDRYNEYISEADFELVTDRSVTYKLMAKCHEMNKMSEMTFMFPGLKKRFYILSDDQKDFFYAGCDTKAYDWLEYAQYPYFGLFPRTGDAMEVYLWRQDYFKMYFSSVEQYHIFTGVIGQYDKKEDRETMTRYELEHESKEIVSVTHEIVECTVNKEDLTKGNIKDQITMNVMKDNVDRFHFMLDAGMRISAFTDDNGFAIPYCRGGVMNNERWIFPIDPYSIAEERKATMYSKGTISQQISLNTYSPANSTWTPRMGYLQCSTLDLLVKVPNPMKAVSVGSIINEWQDDNYSTVYWKSDICIRLYSILYAPYTVKKTEIETPYGPIPLYIYYQPTEELVFIKNTWWSEKHGSDWEKERARSSDRKRIHRFTMKMANMSRVVDEMEGVMNWLTTLYGQYPYPKIAVSQKAYQSGYAQGFPSMLQMFGSFWLSDKDFVRMGYKRGWQDFMPYVLCHEAGHQWWGNIVGWARGQDQWLSEGIDDQQSPNYNQARDGNDDVFNWIKSGWLYNALDHDRTGPVILGGIRLGSSYVPLTYGKAPYIMNMLRLSLGESAFLAIERQFIKIFGFKTSPTTSDFVEVASRALGEKNCMALYNEKDMYWYFDQWIYNRGIPEFAFAWKKYKDGDTWRAKCRVRVTNGIIMKNRARIWIQTSNDPEPYPVWVLLDRKEINEFDLELKGKPTKI